MQSLNLVKSQTLNLTKGTKVKRVRIALGWVTRNAGSLSVDLDASVFGRAANGKLVDVSDILYYNSPRVPGTSKLQIYNGGLVHSGDDLVGGKADDCEIITADLALIPQHVAKESIVITIFNAEAKRQSFKDVSTAYVRIEDADTNQEIGRYNLVGNYDTATAVHIGDIDRDGLDWVFVAVGEAKNNDLNAFVKEWS